MAPSVHTSGHDHALAQKTSHGDGSAPSSGEPDAGRTVPGALLGGLLDHAGQQNYTSWWAEIWIPGMCAVIFKMTCLCVIYIYIYVHMYFI